MSDAELRDQLARALEDAEDADASWLDVADRLLADTETVDAICEYRAHQLNTKNPKE